LFQKELRRSLRNARSEKRVDALEGELARFIAADLWEKLKITQNDSGHSRIHLHRSDDVVNPLGFLSAISTALTDLSLSTSASKVDKFLVVFSSTPSSQTSSSTTVVLICGSDDKAVAVVGDALKAKLGVKGGGKGARWSGKFVGVWKIERENALVDEILTGISDNGN